MLFYKGRSVFIGLALFMIGILSSCQAPPTLATSSAPGISVGISDNTCPDVIVQVGQQVVWTNQGSQEHIVRDISVEGQSEFDSGILKTGDNFAFTFSQPNSYTYECSTDGAITGIITVEP